MLPNPRMQYCLTLTAPGVAPAIVETRLSLGNLIYSLYKLNSATAPGEVLRIERYNRALKRFSDTLSPREHIDPPEQSLT